MKSSTFKFGALALILTFVSLVFSLYLRESSDKNLEEKVTDYINNKKEKVKEKVANFFGKEEEKIEEQKPLDTWKVISWALVGLGFLFAFLSLFKKEHWTFGLLAIAMGLASLFIKTAIFILVGVVACCLIFFLLRAYDFFTGNS